MFHKKKRSNEKKKIEAKVMIFFYLETITRKTNIEEEDHCPCQTPENPDFLKKDKMVI